VVGEEVLGFGACGFGLSGRGCGSAERGLSRGGGAEEVYHFCRGRIELETWYYFCSRNGGFEL
jgi:hypothetical protein